MDNLIRHRVRELNNKVEIEADMMKNFPALMKGLCRGDPGGAHQGEHRPREDRERGRRREGGLGGGHRGADRRRRRAGRRRGRRGGGRQGRAAHCAAGGRRGREEGGGRDCATGMQPLNINYPILLEAFTRWFDRILSVNAFVSHFVWQPMI